MPEESQNNQIQNITEGQRNEVPQEQAEAKEEISATKISVESTPESVPSESNSSESVPFESIPSKSVPTEQIPTEQVTAETSLSEGKEVPAETVPTETVSLPQAEIPSKTASPSVEGLNSPVKPENDDIEGDEQAFVTQPLSVENEKSFIGKLLQKAREKIFSRREKKLQKILAYLGEHNKITNDEVQKLVKVSDATATRLMNILEKRGLVRQVRSRRYAFYELVK